MQSTVAALILTFVYRCGGSDGIAKRKGWRTVFPFNPRTERSVGHLQTRGRDWDKRSVKSTKSVNGDCQQLTHRVNDARRSTARDRVNSAGLRPPRAVGMVVASSDGYAKGRRVVDNG